MFCLKNLPSTLVLISWPQILFIKFNLKILAPKQRPLKFCFKKIALVIWHVQKPQNGATSDDGNDDNSSCDVRCDLKLNYWKATSRHAQRTILSANIHDGDGGGADEDDHHPQEGKS